jgi:hypothetical protein
MPKATHKGQCQLCGAIQKLPAQRLSTHGYKVTFNIFERICPGSLNDPYELSCELIKAELPHIQERIKSLEEQVKEIEIRTGHYGYSQLYSKENHHYYWDIVEFISTDRGLATKHKEQIHNYLHFPFGLTLEQAARYSDKLYIDRVLEARIADNKSYRGWCETRIKQWKLQPLKELTPATI